MLLDKNNKVIESFAADAIVIHLRFFCLDVFDNRTIALFRSYISFPPLPVIWCLHRFAYLLHSYIHNKKRQRFTMCFCNFRVVKFLRSYFPNYRGLRLQGRRSISSQICRQPRSIRGKFMTF